MSVAPNGCVHGRSSGLLDEWPTTDHLSLLRLAISRGQTYSKDVVRKCFGRLLFKHNIEGAKLVLDHFRNTPTPVDVSSHLGDARSLEQAQLLFENKADVNYWCPSYNQPILARTLSDDGEWSSTMIKLLVERGANVRQQLRDSNVLSRYCSSYYGVAFPERAKIVDLLLEHKAACPHKVEWSIDTRNPDERKPVQQVLSKYWFYYAHINFVFGFWVRSKCSILLLIKSRPLWTRDVLRVIFAFSRKSAANARNQKRKREE